MKNNALIVGTTFALIKLRTSPNKRTFRPPYLFEIPRAFFCPERKLLSAVLKAIIILIQPKENNMKWTDSQAIAEALYDKFPDTDPKTIRFTDLMEWVLELDGFNDAPEHCGERILEAIQLAWIDEAA